MILISSYLDLPNLENNMNWINDLNGVRDKGNIQSYIDRYGITDAPFEYFADYYVSKSEDGPRIKEVLRREFTKLVCGHPSYSKAREDIEKKSGSEVSVTFICFTAADYICEALGWPTQFADSIIAASFSIFIIYLKSVGQTYYCENFG